MQEVFKTEINKIVSMKIELITQIIYVFLTITSATKQYFFNRH
jgi:hypothetical protein